jgi:predicted phosphodiesterase
MRYGIVTDIHSNLPALEAVLKKMGKVDVILCMGDIVGYGPQPNEVIDLLRQYKLFSICGNHDLAVLGEIELDDFNVDAIQANLWTRERLTDPNFEWLKSLEPAMKVNDTITLAHGSPVEPIWEYLTTAHAAARSFVEFDTDLCFVGHTHLPRVFRMLNKKQLGSNLPKVEMRIPEPGETVFAFDGKLILNPGSVGQPRDGDTRAAFAIYDENEMTVKFDRAEYNIQATQDLMRDYGLPERLIRRLEYGL